jgi:hypothetical protein
MRKNLLFAAACMLAVTASAQTVQWAKNYPGLGQFTYPKQLETTGSGELVLSGDYNTPYTSSGIFIYKTDGAGNVLWGNTIQSQNPNYGGWMPPRAAGLAVNNAGKIYLGGNFSDSMLINGTSYMNYGPDNVFIAKYDAGGSMDWVQAYNDAVLTDIYSDGTNTYFLLTFSGPIVIFGQTFTSLESSDLLILKVGPSDNLVWSKQLHGTVSAVKFKQAPSGNMFLLGAFSDTLYYDSYQYMWSHGFTDYFLLKMDAAGNQLYYQPLWASQQQSAYDLSISPDEKAMVTGQSCWTNGCVALVKTFDAAGNPLGDVSYWGSTCDYGCGFDVNRTVSTEPGSIWAMGFEQNTLNYGDPNDDWFNLSLTKFDFSGNTISKDTFRVEPAGNESVAKDIAANASGELFLTSTFTGTAQFGAYTLTNPGSDTQFMIMKIGAAATVVDDKGNDDLLKIYPNPSENEFSLQYTCKGRSFLRLKVTNVLGQTVLDRSEEVNGNYTGTIDLAGELKGIYFLELDNGKTKEVRKLILD